MTRIIPAIALCIILAACSGQQIASVGAAVTPAVLSTDSLAKVASTCQAIGPALAVATAPNMPVAVKNTAVYPAAYCSQLLAGTVPPTTDANTPTWFDKTIATLGVVSRVAGVVLPLVL